MTYEIVLIQMGVGVSIFLIHVQDISIRLMLVAERDRHIHSDTIVLLTFARTKRHHCMYAQILLTSSHGTVLITHRASISKYLT